MLSLVSGCRLTSGGLHLGHYLGCLSPLDIFDKPYKYYFVLTDVSPTEKKVIHKEMNSDLLLIASILLSTKYSERIKIILQSDLQESAPNLLSLIQDITTLNQLEHVHPQKLEIKQRCSKLNINDFLFPIQQTFCSTALNANYILMNDDNSRIVHFSRKIVRKINNVHGSTFSLPYLKHGIIPRLLGFNYKKMSKNNHNCIFLTDSSEEVRGKVRQLFKYRYYPDHYKLSDDFLPFLYLRAFNQREEKEIIIADFKSGKMELDHFIEYVFLSIEELIKPIRQGCKVNQENKNYILRKIKEDTREACTEARLSENKLIEVLLR